MKKVDELRCKYEMVARTTMRRLYVKNFNNDNIYYYALCITSDVFTSVALGLSLLFIILQTQVSAPIIILTFSFFYFYILSL